MKNENPKQPGLLRVTRNGKRFFSAEHKRAVIEKCLVPGVSVAAIAMEHGFNANLVRNWVRKHQAAVGVVPPAAQLVPVRVVSAVDTGPMRVAEGGGRSALEIPPGAIDIALGSVRVKVMGRVDPEQLRVVLDSLGALR